MFFEAIQQLVPNADVIIQGNKIIKWNDERKQPTKAQIDKVVRELEAKAVIDNKINAIETFIYSNYPQKKQAQDEQWNEYYKASLEVKKVKDYVVTTVTSAQQIIENGKTLKEVLPAENQEEFSKLIKIATKKIWMRKVVEEGKKSIAEDREPSYPSFPTFEAKAE